MDRTYEAEHWVPEHVRDYLRKLGFVLPLEAMEGFIRGWHGWMSAAGDFYDYRDADGFGRIYEVHRRSIHPAMRVFLSDVLFDRDEEGNGGKKRRTPIPFGKQDCTVFRKVMSSDDMIQDFAPALRTNSQAEAFRIALQMLGDLAGFGISYFDFDDSRGYVKTATEVSSANSALMRNIARHEHALEVSLASISKAVMQVSRGFGVSIPDEGAVRVEFDDSIIQDTAALKAQDMAEVGVTLAPWEYRARWYGESEAVAKERARAVGTVAGGPGA